MRSCVLHCTGRDIQTREVALEFNQDCCVWELRSDSAADAPFLSEEVLEHLLVWLRETVQKIIAVLESENIKYEKLFSIYLTAPKRSGHGRRRFRRWFNGV